MTKQSPRTGHSTDISTKGIAAPALGRLAMTVFFLLLRAAIGALFIYSSFAKLMEPSSNFAGAILGYQIVDARAALWIAEILPWVELAAGSFFILGLWLRITLYTLWAFSAMFIGAISSALLRHIPIHDCGCFGQGSYSLPIEMTLFFDIGLFAIFVLMRNKYSQTARYSLDSLF